MDSRGWGVTWGRRMKRIWAAIVVASAVVLPAAAAQAAPAASMVDCFADLERGTSAQIVCEFPLQPSAAEKAELEKQTSGYLKDATCVVSIRIDRALVAAAIETPDFQFEAPPQPVSCKVTMPGKVGDSVIPITGTFAPKVTIKDGTAVQANPGLANVQGVSRVISWPVVAYVNRAGFLRNGMIKIVNAWMGHMRTAKGRVVAR